LAQAWLCHQPDESNPEIACGQCPSCHGISVRTHADLQVLMPETWMLELEWPLDESTQKELDDKKRKPSREIRVEAARELIAFTQRTASGPMGKVVLIYPADRMNGITANTLLKTLEEPAGDTRFVLATDAQHLLLPTIRSRCLGHTLSWPIPEEGVSWLCSQGLTASEAKGLLKAAGGRPDDAIALARTGFNAKRWSAIPRALKSGDTAPLQDVGGSLLVSVLQKVCHDQLSLCMGAEPRFFEPEDLVSCGNIHSLTEWSRSLQRSARSAEHPFHAGLMQDALLGQASTALR
jgi:DNA polymerase-3 subunit delta'